MCLIIHNSLTMICRLCLCKSALHFFVQCRAVMLRRKVAHHHLAAGLQHSAHVQPIINCIWIMRRRRCCSPSYCCSCCCRYCCCCCCSCIPASPAESAFCGLCGAACAELAPTTSTEASTACACCDWVDIDVCVCVCVQPVALVWVARIIYSAASKKSCCCRAAPATLPRPLFAFCLLNYKTNGPHINKLATRNVCAASTWLGSGIRRKCGAHPATSCIGLAAWGMQQAHAQSQGLPHEKFLALRRGVYN